MGRKSGPLGDLAYWIRGRQRLRRAQLKEAFSDIRLLEAFLPRIVGGERPGWGRPPPSGLKPTDICIGRFDRDDGTVDLFPADLSSAAWRCPSFEILFLSGSPVYVSGKEEKCVSST